MAPMAPSFFQMGEEVTSQVGVVHGASTASATSATVGEVHMDRTRQMRQWQEDAVEIYTDTHAASATAKTAATVVAATISESRGALAKMQIFLTASGLWLAVLFFLLVVLVATWLGRWWAAPAKAETEAEAAEETDDTAKPSVQFIPRPSCDSKSKPSSISKPLGHQLISPIPNFDSGGRRSLTPWISRFHWSVLPPFASTSPAPISRCWTPWKTIGHHPSR